MRAALAAAALTLLGLATASVADAPVRSPLPPARPTAPGPALTPAAAPPTQSTLVNPTARAPLTSPRPPQRAVASPKAAAPVAIAAASALAPALSPIPQIRPAPLQATRFIAPTMVLAANPTRLAPLSSPVPPARPADGGEIVLTSAPLPKATAKASRKGSVCGNPAIKGAEMGVIRASVNGCGLSDAMQVTSVSGVQLSTPAQLDCVTAEALNAWVENALIPAVGATGGGVAKLQVAASYVCRPRNNQKGNRISEHGKGRAIDVTAIVLENGKVISVLSDWGKGRGGKILKAVRKAACGTFTTVLGPGSDRFHRDHLHLDTARGRGPYCR